ncbi:hypothetical protein KJ628_02135 [Patescibacteria group bacterium]|nr:hypothetical protein [Patescibacteria group bacterium]
MKRKRKKFKLPSLKTLEPKKSKRSRMRQNEKKQRKNIFLNLILIVFLWVSVGFVVYFIDPFSIGAVYLFLVLIFLALLFTFSTFFANTRRGFLIAFGLTLFLIFRYFGVGNILNFLLIVALVITVEMYQLKS